jgi:hypothetical protein
MIFNRGFFHLLMAPPAWGKTRLFQDWSRSAPGNFLFISPLRALAIEVKARCPGVWVALPEELLSLDWQQLALERPELVVVWDEIHLIPVWGESFRHALLECWYGFCLSGLAGVGLSATVTEELKLFLQSSLTESHDVLITGDAGNFSFKHKPTRYWSGPTSWIKETLLVPQGRTLIFCRTRFEVTEWCEWLRSEGENAWGCLGGETRQFSERLLSEPAPDWIIATSCLSHGVNLPEIKRVIVLDTTVSDWMLHQMMTRAGRKGEGYDVWLSAGIPLSWTIKVSALLRLAILVMIVRLRKTLKAWWHGTGRLSYSDHPSKRARPHRSHALARRHDGEPLRLWWYGRWKKRQAARF